MWKEQNSPSAAMKEKYQTAQITHICVYFCLSGVLILKLVCVLNRLFNDSHMVQTEKWETRKIKVMLWENSEVYWGNLHYIVRHLNCGGEFSGLDWFLFIWRVWGEREKYKNVHTALIIRKLESSSTDDKVKKKKCSAMSFVLSFDAFAFCREILYVLV